MGNKWVPRIRAKASSQTFSPRSASRGTDRSETPLTAAVSAVNSALATPHSGGGFGCERRRNFCACVALRGVGGMCAGNVLRCLGVQFEIDRFAPLLAWLLLG